MQAKSKHAASVMVDTIQDNMATEQNIRGEGMFCVSKLRSSTDYFLMLVGTSKKKLVIDFLTAKGNIFRHSQANLISKVIELLIK